MADVASIELSPIGQHWNGVDDRAVDGERAEEQRGEDDPESARPERFRARQSMGGGSFRRVRRGAEGVFGLAQEEKQDRQPPQRNDRRKRLKGAAPAVRFYYMAD